MVLKFLMPFSLLLAFPLLCCSLPPSLPPHLQRDNLVLQHLPKYRRHLHFYWEREGGPIPEFKVGAMHRRAFLPLFSHLEAEGLGRDAGGLGGDLEIEVIGALREGKGERRE